METSACLLDVIFFERDGDFKFKRFFPIPQIEPFIFIYFILSIPKPPAGAAQNMMGLLYQLMVHRVVVRLQVADDK